LYLRPLPHQHTSLAAGSTFGGSGLERTKSGYWGTAVGVLLHEAQLARGNQRHT